VVTDANGHAATLTYDSNGNLLSETNGEGETTTYRYVAANYADGLTGRFAATLIGRVTSTDAGDPTFGDIEITELGVGTDSPLSGPDREQVTAFFALLAYHLGTFAMNDIGRITLRTAQPVIHDSYRRNRQTGSFILVDPGTNETVAAGMII